MTGPDLSRLVVLGAAGDLAMRHLLKAVNQLEAVGASPARQIHGVDVRPWTTETYREHATEVLEGPSAASSARDAAAVLRRLHYHQADLRRSPDLRHVLGSEPVIAYLALPAALYPAAVGTLRASGLPTGSRIVVEKPFGHDRASAQELTGLLHSLVDEQDVFRVDHFLYHQVVQDLLAFRFANPFFEPLWNGDHVEQVEVLWEEGAGVQGRAEFYDTTGALRDMVQSHLLQVAALVLMDRPERLDQTSLPARRAHALRGLRTPAPEEIAVRTRRARYTAGLVDGRCQAPYVDEPGVDPARETETFAEVELRSTASRWQDVPLVLRTGRALGEPRRQVALRFRGSTSPPLAHGSLTMTLQMAPGDVAVETNVSGGLAGLPQVESLALRTRRPEQQLSASARMLRDVCSGDWTWSVRADEVEECWRIVDAVLATWRTGVPTLREYPAGSRGPVA